jgi:hypothetical protein
MVNNQLRIRFSHLATADCLLPAADCLLDTAIQKVARHLPRCAVKDKMSPLVRKEGISKVKN